jgi:hypothetical protein
MKPARLFLLAGACAMGAGVLSARDAGAPQGLKPVAEFASIPDQRARSLALFAEMGKVITSPRCLNCHPRGDRPTQTDAMLPHSPPVLRGASGEGVPGLACTTCHGPANTSFFNGEGGVPGDPHWKLAPLEMGWQHKSLGDICRQLSDPARNGGRSLDKIVEHVGTDHLVGWAWHPGAGRTPAPGTQAQMEQLTQAWVDSGARCPD